LIWRVGERKQRIPFGNDRQKSKDKGKNKSKRRSFASLRMTAFCSVSLRIAQDDSFLFWFVALRSG
jgi:hypothetical protein